MDNNNTIMKRLADYADREYERREYLRIHQEDIKKLEQEYGKFDGFYDDSRTIVFSAKNQPMPENEKSDWFSFWKETFKGDFKYFMKDKGLEGDFDFNTETGEITLHTKDGDKHFETKVFCHIDTALDADTYEVKRTTYRPLAGYTKFEQID